MSTLSTCMIVKNEEEHLAECLDCIRRFSDEIVIVDTGSTDNTVAIARQYTDNVYFFPWQNDFSLARNESYRHATSDYILWMDADNYIDPENCEKLIALKAELKEENSIFLNLYSDELGRFRADHRITRRNPQLSWYYPIHEQYPVMEPVRFADIQVEHRFSGKVEPDYLAYLRNMPQEEIASQFWFLAQCYQDFTRCGCREEAEHYRDILLHKNWDWQEKLSPSIDAANVLEYYGFYEEAMWWYDYLFQIEEFKKYSPKSYLKMCKHAITCRKKWKQKKAQVRQEQREQEPQEQKGKINDRNSICHT